MEKSLSILGLEYCHAYSVPGDWFYKKFNSVWYFRRTDGHSTGWLEIDARDFDTMMDNMYVVKLTKIIQKKDIVRMSINPMGT